MSESFGSGPSRVLDPADLAYQLTVFMSGNPPTDAEVNYIGQINNEERRKLIKSMMPSGIIGDPNRAHLDFHSHVSYSNYFYMGRQLEVETATTSTHTTGLKHILWANVDGWIIPVTGTQVNESVLVDDDYRNKIVLPFGPSSDFNTNFVFLEVWKALIERTPSATNKPTANTIYKFGNVEFGGTNPTEDLTAPDIGSETTKRVQIQYRIRVLSNVDLISYPTGFESTSQVYARANLSEGAAATLAGSLDTSFRPQGANGDPGLWRAGNGNANNGLGTVDGYVYAIPLFGVRRRNRGGYSLSTVNGGISRKSPPGGYVEGTPSACTLTALELSSAPASDRPDGKYTDLIVVGGDDTDIIDMRFHVWPGGHDYQSILDENLKAISANKLRTSAKMFTLGGTQFGPTLLQTDELNNTGTDTPQTILVGEPDGVRKIFSDVPVYQGRNFEAVPIASKDPSSPSWGANPSIWLPGDVIKIAHPDSLNGEDYPSEMLADQFELTYRGGTRPVLTGVVTAATGTTLSSTGAFAAYSPFVSNEIKGYAVEITGGTGSGQIRTVDTVNSANQISIFGSWTVTPDTTSSFQVVPLIMTASAVSDTTEMTITIDTINGDDDPTSADLISANLTGDMWVEYTMFYPAGQGMALRPDTIHLVNYTNPSATVLVTPGADASVNRMQPRSINHCPDFVNRALSSYFGSNAVTADCYVDEGSKTQVIQPWQRFSNAVQIRRAHEFIPGHSYFSLFHTEFIFELPKSRMPAMGYNAIPPLSSADAGSIFFSGLNVWLISEADAAAETAINLLGRSDFDDDSFEGDEVFVRAGVAYEAVSAGTPDRIGCKTNAVVGGIEFPRYIGISRIIAIFTQTDFNSNGMSATNLLVIPDENDEVEANIWIGRTPGNTDVTFTILPAAISGYSDVTNYVIICNVFGFREGFLTENTYITAHEQVTDENTTVTLHTVVTGGLPSTAVVQTTYTRTPYQASVYSRMEPFADNTPEPYNNRGLVSPTDLTNLETPLVDDPEQGVTYNFEVLATREFVTTLGTARFSGVGNGRFYGKKNMATSLPDGAPQHEILALSDVSEQHAGFISRLPLGARFRDADFAGENVLTGTDDGPLIFFSDGEVKPNAEMYDESTNSDALGAGQIITTTQGNLSAYALDTRFRATRGGSGYQRLESAEGAPLTAGGRLVGIGYKALYGVAALVRNFRETTPTNVDQPFHAISNPNVMKSPGGELHMVILTGASPSIYPIQSLYEAQQVFAASAPTGIGEGLTAVDRYRCIGRPLEFQPLELNLDASSDVVENGLMERPRLPGILSSYPELANSDNVVLVRGVGIAADRSEYPYPAELYARPVDALNDNSLINLSAYITDTGEDYIAFAVPETDVMPRGRYDLIVRSPSGQIARLRNSLESTAIAVNDRSVYAVENYTDYEPGDFPAGVGGIIANSTGSFRVTDADSRVGYQSALFRGTGLATTEYVRIVRNNTAVLGTDIVSMRISFRLLEAVPTSNTLTLKFETVSAGVFANLVSMVVADVSTFFGFVVHGGINGGVDLTVTSAVPVDTEWHDFEFIVNGNTSNWRVLLDGELVGSSTAAGTAIGLEVRRLEISNSRTAGITAARCFIDRLVIQNYAASGLLG
jgi:hypothetical protein